MHPKTLRFSNKINPLYILLSLTLGAMQHGPAFGATPQCTELQVGAITKISASSTGELPNCFETDFKSEVKSVTFLAHASKPTAFNIQIHSDSQKHDNGKIESDKSGMATQTIHTQSRKATFFINFPTTPQTTFTINANSQKDIGIVYITIENQQPDRNPAQ